jgi:uncharacterized membrane protein (DUF485 family)
MGRKIAWVVSLALLLLTGFLGIHNGVTEWDPANNPIQKSVTAGVFLYGILGFVTAYGLFLRRRWSFPTAMAWGVVVTYVPGVAVMSFSDEGTLTSAFAASGTTALIAAGVIWTTYVMTRRGTESAAPAQ